MAEILVKGKPWHYEASSYYDVANDYIDHEDAIYVLKHAKEILDKAGIVFMPMYGTLLGIIRQNDFIPKDYDMDLAVFGRDRQNLIDLIPEFDKVGIKFTRCSEPWVYTFKYKSADCDFYMINDSCWPYNYRYVRIVTKYIQRNFFTELKTVNFKGVDISVPKRSEELMEYFYGREWRIPKPGQARTQSRILFWFNIWRFGKRCFSYVKRRYLA